MSENNEQSHDQFLDQMVEKGNEMLNHGHSKQEVAEMIAEKSDLYHGRDAQDFTYREFRYGLEEAIEKGFEERDEYIKQHSERLMKGAAMRRRNALAEQQERRKGFAKSAEGLLPAEKKEVLEKPQTIQELIKQDKKRVEEQAEKRKEIQRQFNNRYGKPTPRPKV